MQHEVALPSSVSVFAKMFARRSGNYFGGPSLAAIDAKMAGYPISELDPYWQDISQSYVEYVMAQLQLSVVRPRGERMRYFHEWRKGENRRRPGHAAPRERPRLSAACWRGL